MSLPLRNIVLMVGGMVVLLALWQISNAAYFRPRAELRDDLAQLQDRIRDWENELDARARQRLDLQAIVERTLGGDLETVDHQLRSRLNRITEKVGLSGPTVGTGSAAARQSPARQVFRGRSPLEREMRDMIDFVELEGSVSGEGSLEQIIASIDRIQAEPWMGRIDSLRIDPRRTGDRFGVTLRLTTLFLPGRAEHSLARVDPANPGDAYDASRLARYAGLLSANPFRVPSREEARPAARPAEPARFPYAQWYLTGVAESTSGAEAWLLNRSSGERMSLLNGQSISEAVFVGLADQDQATFEIAEDRFVVSVGRHLDDRTPVSQ